MLDQMHEHIKGHLNNIMAYRQVTYMSFQVLSFFFVVGT